MINDEDNYKDDDDETENFAYDNLEINETFVIGHWNMRNIGVDKKETSKDDNNNMTQLSFHIMGEVYSDMVFWIKIQKWNWKIHIFKYKDLCSNIEI